MNRDRRLALVLGALLVAATPAAAQSYRNLTDEAAAALVAFHNAEGTSRIAGDVLIARGSQLRGDAAILNGPLVVEGEVSGRILVVNGSVFLTPGARVTGELVVVGGDVEGAADATVDGEIVVYREALQYRRVGELIQPERVEPIAGLSAGREFEFGRTSFSVAMSGAYNRVEGLPISLGPRVTFGHSNPTVIEALLVYRTAGGFTLEERQIGHLVSVEQFLGGHGRFRLGATLRSQVVPIEAGGVSDTESALATFLLHRDYRDHFERNGWSGYLRWSNDGRPLDVKLEYRHEEHDTRAALTPWTLFDNGEPFRPQPLVGVGSLNTVALRIEHDSRNEVEDPSSGWLLRLESEQGVGGEMSVRVSPDGAGGLSIDPWDIDERFSAMSLDARRYLRLGPLTRLAVRAWAAGSLDGGPLPPQRQHALGGEGTIPGYELFRFDCGARELSASFDGEGVAYFLYYGCDRAVLGQLSLERTLPFVKPLGRSLGLDFDLGPEPALALFADVGRAWIEDDALRGREAGTSGFEADAGIGVRFGRVGFYWAVPVTGDGGANFFVRIGPRI